MKLKIKKEHNTKLIHKWAKIYKVSRADLRYELWISPHHNKLTDNKVEKAAKYIADAPKRAEAHFKKTYSSKVYRLQTIKKLEAKRRKYRKLGLETTDKEYIKVTKLIERIENV